MSDRIDLTDEQMRQVICGLSGRLSSAWGRGEIEKVVEAINAAIVGDPVGTIRRNIDGAIAVRARYRDSDKHLGWRVYRNHHLPQRKYAAAKAPTEEWIGPAGECYWPVIYRPEVL